MPVSCRKSRHSVHRCQQAHLWDSAQTLFPTVLPISSLPQFYRLRRRYHPSFSWSSGSSPPPSKAAFLSTHHVTHPPKARALASIVRPVWRHEQQGSLWRTRKWKCEKRGDKVPARRRNVSTETSMSACHSQARCRLPRPQRLSHVPRL